MSLDDYIRDIQELRRGNVPEHIANEYKILSPDNPITQAFAPHMQKLWERLIGATNQGGYDPQKHQVRFLLSASDDVNAFVFTDSVPPTIVLTKGLISKLQTEGEIAGVLMHEKLHSILKDRLGLHPNSYMEESGADMYGAYALYKAGFPPGEMATALNKLPHDGVVNMVDKMLQVGTDPHPPIEERVRVVEDTVAILQRLQGLSTATSQDIDPAFKAQIASATFESAFGKRLAAITEEGVAPAEQLRRAANFIPDLQRLPDNEWAESQIQRFFTDLTKIDISPSREEDKLAYKEFMQRLYAKPEAVSRRWQRSLVLGHSNGAVEHLDQKLGLDRIRDFNTRAEYAGLPANEIKKAAQGMIGAVTEAEFLTHASNLARMLDVYNTDSNSLTLKLSGVLYNYPTQAIDASQVQAINDSIIQAGDSPQALSEAIAKHGIKLPWHDHITWAQQAMAGGHPEAMKALHYLGIGNVDPRVAEFPGVSPIDGGIHQKSRMLINPANGMIQGTIDRRQETSYSRPLNLEKEKERLAAFDLQQKAAVATADWGLLERDFHEFTRQYKRFLSPLGTDWPESAPFAQRFIQESEKLLAKDRAKYAPLLKEYLGITDETAAHLRDIYTRAQSKDIIELARAESDYNRLSYHAPYSDRSMVMRRSDAFSDTHLDIIQGGKFEIHPTHPFVGFVVQDKHNLFSVADKVELLSGVVGGFIHPIAAPERVYGFATPNTMQELRAAMDVVRTSPLDASSDRANYTGMANDYLRFNYLVNHPDEAYSRRDLELFTSVHRLDGSNFNAGGLPEQDVIKAILAKHNERLVAHEISPQSTLEETIQGFRQFADEGNSYFKQHPEIRVQYEQKILAGLAQLRDADPQEASRLTKMLLYTEHKGHIGQLGALRGNGKTMTPEFLNSKFKQEVMSHYVAAQAALLGTDDLSQQYSTRAKAAIDEVVARVSGNSRYEILRDLTDAVVSGKEVSYYARDSLMRITNDQISHADNSLRGSYMANQFLEKKSPERQASFIKFLRGGYDEQSAVEFLRVIEDREKYEALKLREQELQEQAKAQKAKIAIIDQAMDDNRKLAAQNQGEGFIPTVASEERSTQLYKEYIKLEEQRREHAYAIHSIESELENKVKTELQNRDFATTKLWKQIITGDVYTDSAPVTEAQKILYLQMQHDNFWAMSTEGRTMVLSRQLFPTDMPDAEAEAHFQQQKSRILAEQLPDSMKSGSDARVIAEKYMEHIPRAEARLFLSALIASRDPRVAHEASLGDAIGLLAKAMGSAENKLAQVGHSLEATPDDIRAGLAHSKSDYKKPSRWASFEWIETHGPPAAGQAHVGALLGAGSYNVTWPLEYPDGRQTALNMLRPYVEESSTYGFDILEKTARALVADDRKYQPLLDLVQETRRQFPNEVNTRLAAGQAIVADQNYHGTVVKAGGYEFHITTADWIAHGDSYKETLIAPGKHFSDLPESTSAELAFKKAAAKALFTVELSQWSRGHATDPDRHGKQQKIIADPNNPTVALVTMFDHGMQKLDAPSLKTQMVAGRAIESAVALSKKSGIGFGEALASVIDAKVSGYADSVPPEEIQHLSSLKRGLLQMGDYVQYMDKADIAESISAIRKAGAVSTGLKLGIMQERVSSEGVAGLLPRFGGSEAKPDPANRIVLAHDFATVEQTKLRLNPSYAALVNPAPPKPVLTIVPDTGQQVAPPQESNRPAPGPRGNRPGSSSVIGIAPQPLPLNTTPVVGGLALVAELQTPLQLAPATETIVSPAHMPAAANEPSINPTPKADVKPTPHTPVTTAPKVHAATRTTGSAGAALGIKGLVDSFSEGGSYQKASQVGGEQLYSERAAIAGDVAGIATGAGDIIGKASKAVQFLGRAAPIVAAGGTILRVNAADKAQDGRTGIGAITGFVGAMGSGAATGFVAGTQTANPWVTAGSAFGGALVGGYLATDAGKESQLGDQRQRDLDHAAQVIIDKNIATFQTLEKMRLYGGMWIKPERITVRQITKAMHEQYMRLSVLDIPPTDIDGHMRLEFQKRQTLQFIDYMNGKEGTPMPQSSIEVASNLSRKLDALLPQLNDPKLGWQKYLDADGDGKVSRADVLATLSKYGAEIHTLSMDGINLTIGELTGALKALGVDQGTTRTERVGRAIQTTSLVPLINDEVHENFGGRAGYGKFIEAIKAQLPALEKLGISKYIGNGDSKITLDEIMDTCKKNGIRISEIDRDGDGKITAGEIVQALQTRGIGMPQANGKNDSGRT